MLDIDSKYDIINSSNREADFLYQLGVASRTGKLNRFFIGCPKVAPFNLEDKMKQCSKCKKQKPKIEFHKNKAHKDGLCWWCKKCTNKKNMESHWRYRAKRLAHQKKYRQEHREEKLIQDKEYRKKHRKKLYVYQKNYRQEIQKKWLSHLLQNPKCEICEKPLDYFTGNQMTSVNFDHKKSNLPIKRPSNWLQSRLPNSQNLKIWKSCNFGILCVNCNLALRIKNRKKWVKNMLCYVDNEQDYPKNLQKLLQFYRDFCEVERQRIVKAHKKYGSDWEYKNNKLEQWYEILDEFGYKALHWAQKQIRHKSK